MRHCVCKFLYPFLFLFAATWISPVFAQSGATSGTISGTVTDSTGAVVAGATVTIVNSVSQYSRSTATDGAGHFTLPNIPFNPYGIEVSDKGFASYSAAVSVDSVVPVTANAVLRVGGSGTTVTVNSINVGVEDTPTFHTDVDRNLMEKLPLESQSSSLSSLVTLASPGVAADSNGLFHGLGDHASNSFSIDGQPVTDQQSKVFSNQLPINAVQSIEVISGAPPAEYGDKTSLVIDVTTRSGQGLTKPTGDITSSYGTFGSADGSVDLGYGSQKRGNFFEFDGLNTGRFLDPPEFVVFHDKGNEQNLFDRIDNQFTQNQSAHLDLNYSRSWFQTPNSYDNLNVQNVVNGTGSSASPTFGNVGNTDQHSKIETFNIAPTYTRIVSSDSVFNLGAYIRRDSYNYYPSSNPFADLGPPNLQNQTIGQYRTLTNAGLRSDFTYVKGINNIKAGASYEQTFLRENDSLGIVAPTFNSPCLDQNGNPVAGYTDPSQCAAPGLQPNDGSNPNVSATPFNPVLLPYDLTRNGGLYSYFGHTDVKELALYIDDQIKAGNWAFRLGIRGDLYNGLTVARQAEPRLGVAYTVKPTGTVIQLSYARTLETPFNENLV
ncbi:MAG TPA: TonB-dependent receptor, partial [Acidobacteriaceae bacterium]|nr:TonB-dependent receptor [Acidobacteriaceae bacterium]